MNDASGETRKETSPATSSGRPTRPIRLCDITYA